MNKPHYKLAMECTHALCTMLGLIKPILIKCYTEDTSKHFPVKKCFPDWVISSEHSSPYMTSQPQIFPMMLLWFTYQSHTYFPSLELGSSEAKPTHLCGPDCPGKCAALRNALWRVMMLFPLPPFWKRVSPCSPLCSQTQDLLSTAFQVLGL